MEKQGMQCAPRKALGLGALVALVMLAPLALSRGHAEELPERVAPEAQSPSAATGQHGDPAGARVLELSALLRTDEFFALLEAEGQSYGDSLEAAMFPERGGQPWQDRVMQVYQDPKVRARFDAAFAAAYQGEAAALDLATSFYGADLGKRLTAAELDARAIILDEDAMEAAEVAVEKLQLARAPRLRLLKRIIEAGDMIDSNVAGTMTGLLAFDRGLSEASPAALAMPEAERQANLWSEEGQIRHDTINWLTAYLNLAYQGFSDAELEDYLRFLSSPEGQRLIMARYAGFDAAMVPVMQALGYEAGLVLQGREI